MADVHWSITAHLATIKKIVIEARRLSKKNRHSERHTHTHTYPLIGIPSTKISILQNLRGCPLRQSTASLRFSCTGQSAAGDAYVVGVYRDDTWDPDNSGPSMPFVPLAALMFLLGNVFDRHRQQDDPASVPLLTPHTGGGIDPPPVWVVHGGPAFRTACGVVRGGDEWAPARPPAASWPCPGS